GCDYFLRDTELERWAECRGVRVPAFAGFRQTGRARGRRWPGRNRCRREQPATRPDLLCRRASTGGRRRAGALAWVETRPSILYGRLFAVLGDYAQGVEYILFSIAIVFAVIEGLALWVGTKLTRSITSSVADLYEATMHVNRGDFSHRIAVKSNDQLAALANSFNSMTASIERLVLEQKEKQRLENELSIAQEVQAQLFPKEISQLESLEVH